MPTSDEEAAAGKPIRNRTIQDRIRQNKTELTKPSGERCAARQGKELAS